jgi:hypothetical protein
MVMGGSSLVSMTPHGLANHKNDPEVPCGAILARVQG